MVRRRRNRVAHAGGQLENRCVLACAIGGRSRAQGNAGLQTGLIPSQGAVIGCHKGRLLHLGQVGDLEQAEFSSNACFPDKTRIGSLQLVQMRHRVGAVGGVQEEHPRFAIVVRLGNDFIEQLTGAHGFIRFEGYARCFGLFEGTVETMIAGSIYIREAQFPHSVFTHGAHKSIRNPHRNIEIGDGVFIRLTGNELFDIRVIHAQHGHIGAPPGTALSDLAKSLIIDT